jgi:single-strand DNA-binding protein
MNFENSRGNSSENTISFILQDKGMLVRWGQTGKEGRCSVINQVTLVGRLTKDPEPRVTPDGKSVLNATIALTRRFRNQQGQFEADFVLCTLWNKAAENTAKYCKKGSVIGIVGRLQTRNYENEQGKRIYVTEVVAESVKFLDGKPAQPQKSTDKIELPF